MGYDLHITRARRWTDSERCPASEGEWRAHVRADPQLVLTGSAEADTPDGVLTWELGRMY